MGGGGGLVSLICFLFLYSFAVFLLLYLVVFVCFLFLFLGGCLFFVGFLFSFSLGGLTVLCFGVLALYCKKAISTSVTFAPPHLNPIPGELLFAFGFDVVDIVAVVVVVVCLLFNHISAGPYAAIGPTDHCGSCVSFGT